MWMSNCHKTATTIDLALCYHQQTRGKTFTLHWQKAIGPTPRTQGTRTPISLGIVGSQPCLLHFKSLHRVCTFRTPSSRSLGKLVTYSAKLESSFKEIAAPVVWLPYAVKVICYVLDTSLASSTRHTNTSRRTSITWYVFKQKYASKIHICTFLHGGTSITCHVATLRRTIMQYAQPTGDKP